MAANGQYETIPLEKDVVRLALVQSDAARIKEGDVPADVIGQNLEHMMEMGTSACEGEEKPDIILYHEFPLTGYISGERDEKLTKTIGVPGRKQNDWLNWQKLAMLMLCLVLMRIIPTGPSTF